ncbi:hypothetical protein ACMD2_03255 [Ananas comosus]|uniref:Amino acid transporter transmembrane domain-containing protein n=1 Tax=Ananas comosus TaxID=4615 RepID=A0A199V144_ANACO|nr:hypothetical protein ACMD2_03255 [Ananas comosus]
MIAPVVTAIEERLITVIKRSATLLIRSLVVLSTVVIALTIPFFGSLMALIGSLLSIIVSMMLPCICYIKIFGASQVRKVELVLISEILLTVFYPKSSSVSVTDSEGKLILCTIVKNSFQRLRIESIRDACMYVVGDALSSDSL